MNQDQPKQAVQTVQISHLQLLINAVVLAYHRNAFTLKEAGTIYKAVEHFTEQTGAAVMPQVQKSGGEPAPPTKPTVPSTQVSPVTQAGGANPQTVHTIQPEESKPESNLVLNVAEEN